MLESHVQVYTLYAIFIVATVKKQLNVNFLGTLIEPPAISSQQ